MRIWRAIVYGLDAGPNFRDPHHPDEPARNVLRLEARPEQIAARLGVSEAEFGERMARINAALYVARAKRKQPRLDDKVLTAWNGLMIAGLARAGAAMKDSGMVEMAGVAARAVLAQMRTPGGAGLLRSRRNGEGTTPGMLEDYAMLIAGLIALERAESGKGGGSWVQAAEGVDARGYGHVRR